MENNKKKIVISIIFVIILIGLVAGISYAAATWTRVSSDNTVNTGSISMSYVEPTNALVLENALPMSDAEGASQTKYFEFTVSTHATTNASDNTGITIPYEVNISDIETTNEELAKYFVKLNLSTVSGNTEEEVLAPTTITNLDLSSLRENATKVYETTDVHKNGSNTKTTTYRLRAWLDESYFVTSGDTTAYQYKFRVNVNSAVNAVGKDTSATTNTKYLSKAILDQGIVTSGDGLYVSTATNTSQPTYYYHGNVTNNCVSFAGETWRIVRINEDGTIRMIMQNGIDNNNRYHLNANNNEFIYMYYSESNIENGAMKRLNDWYTNNLTSYDSKIATSSYCEQLKLTMYSSETMDTVDSYTPNNYIPNFYCQNDGNGYGLIKNQKIGLINIDELLLAGGQFNVGNSELYFMNGQDSLVMSPAGIVNGETSTWYLQANGGLYRYISNGWYSLRPVINLVSDITTADVPFVTCPADAA